MFRYSATISYSQILLALMFLAALALVVCEIRRLSNEKIHGKRTDSENRCKRPVGFIISIMLLITGGYYWANPIHPPFRMRTGFIFEIAYLCFGEKAAAMVFWALAVLLLMLVIDMRPKKNR